MKTTAIVGGFSCFAAGFCFGYFTRRLIEKKKSVTEEASPEITTEKSEDDISVESSEPERKNYKSYFQLLKEEQYAAEESPEDDDPDEETSEETAELDNNQMEKDVKEYLSENKGKVIYLTGEEFDPCFDHEELYFYPHNEKRNVDVLMTSDGEEIPPEDQGKWIGTGLLRHGFPSEDVTSLEIRNIPKQKDFTLLLREGEPEDDIG